MSAWQKIDNLMESEQIYGDDIKAKVPTAPSCMASKPLGIKTTLVFKEMQMEKTEIPFLINQI